MDDLCCGGRGRDRGRDRGGNHEHHDPIVWRFCENSVEQGPANRPETPLKPKKVWAVRVRLQLEQRRRDLALFNLAIDSKLRACDLVRLRVGGQVRDRASVVQSKTVRPVQFEITELTRAAIRDWIAMQQTSASFFVVPSR
jgi:hypothetical protein